MTIDNQIFTKPFKITIRIYHATEEIEIMKILLHIAVQTSNLSYTLYASCSLRSITKINVDYVNLNVFLKFQSFP